MVPRAGPGTRSAQAQLPSSTAVRPSRVSSPLFTPMSLQNQEFFQSGCRARHCSQPSEDTGSCFLYPLGRFATGPKQRSALWGTPRGPSACRLQPPWSSRTLSSVFAAQGPAWVARQYCGLGPPSGQEAGADTGLPMFPGSFHS